MVAKFYEGTYLYKRGYPTILVVATFASGGTYVGEAFIVIEKVPSGTGFETLYYRQTYPQGAQTFKSLGITSPEDFIAANALHGAKGLVYNCQLDEYEKTKAEVALKPVEFREVEKWDLEVLRWRLRGLSENTLAKMADQVADADVAAVFVQVMKQLPIQVQSATE